MAAIFDELGVKVDVPELHPDMSEEDLAEAAARLADGMRVAGEQRTRKAASHRKTQRELREGERARRFEQLRKDNSGAVYKRLAKVLHPDLEADTVEREKKSRGMQEVTAATRAPTCTRCCVSSWNGSKARDSVRHTSALKNCAPT